jgi:hypothetical protein
LIGSRESCNTVQIGEIYRHEAFYRNAETGEFEAKYLVLLATLPSGDFVARLLTSRQHGRPEQPACFHGNPYPSYYLGVLGGRLSAKSWLDLRFLDDFDEVEFRRRIKSNRIALVGLVSTKALIDLLACVAGAEDTTRLQENAIRDGLATLL